MGNCDFYGCLNCWKMHSLLFYETHFVPLYTHCKHQKTSFLGGQKISSKKDQPCRWVVYLSKNRVWDGGREDSAFMDLVQRARFYICFGTTMSWRRWFLSRIFVTKTLFFVMISAANISFSLRLVYAKLNNTSSI